MRAFREVWDSNVFQKWLMAITGLLLVGFLLGHLSGNLLVFMGPDHINEYAHGLRTMLHGTAIWIVRLGLLTSFVLHVTSAIKLARRNRAARPNAYSTVEHRASTLASRSMLYSGLLLLTYALYHLAHFTWGVVHSEYYAKTCPPSAECSGAECIPDVYSMIVSSFQVPLISVAYVLAMIMVGLHLNHAIASAFQTLGLRNERFVPIVRTVGPLLGILVAAGFSSVPLAILAGIVK
ncbi:MAG: succinate dehydrogenase cytochrome b subunit [Ignavibacteria bacterium]|jgi:succinate dehydrogenase / fumarate reductase cytochrome b subunit